ncbi:MAG: septum formation protein Maf [Spirochaetes bacterium RBG_13_51_14]|nr:MAG: septum formation protein Maf [Spirochaetes bacterium RBG_13_51_14]
MNVILGSTSPRRKSIVSGLVESFCVVPPSVDETHRPPESPTEFATRIAGEKCASILESGAVESTPALVITADTVVTVDGAIIGKPADFDDAVRIITLLSGRTHRVITGLTLHAVSSGGRVNHTRTGHETTEVRFKKLVPEEITRYLAANDYRDKAGAYAFQEQGHLIIAGYRGSVTNIIGFPLRLFFSMAAEMALIGEIFAV